MREIKFRALKDDISNCRFYYGNLIRSSEGEPRIQDLNNMSFHTCIKGTVGQFTGLKDKNGKDIYEGDILHCSGCDYNLIKHISGAYELHEIGSDKIFFLFKQHKIIEVIGNIHENNPEKYNWNNCPNDHDTMARYGYSGECDKCGNEF